VASTLAFSEIPPASCRPAPATGWHGSLGFPGSPRRLRQAIAAEPRRIDVGELGDRFFVNFGARPAPVARCFNQSGSVAAVC
jgi:hypothetical protein